MFNWLRRNKHKCKLCENDFNSKKPDEIVFEHQDGKTERLIICTVCAATLELIKKKNYENIGANIRIDSDTD